MGAVTSLLSFSTPLPPAPQIAAPVISDNVSTRTTPYAAPAPLSILPITDNANQPSSSFLAQLLSQSDDDSTVALATSFAHFAPAPEYNAFSGYSYIKYKPSDAGVPPSPSALPSPVIDYAPTSAQPAASAPVSSAAQDQTALSAQENGTENLPQTQIKLNGGEVAANVSAAIPVPASNALPAAGIAVSELSAYSATQSRNQSNLSPSAPPQLVIAG